MIAAIALCAALGPVNPVAELIDPAARIVSVQAIVKLPHLSGHEMAEMQLLAETLADGTEGFTRAQMRELAAPAGESLRITLMPDHLRIEFGVLPRDMKTALTYVDQILRTATFSDEGLNKALEDVPFRARSLWATALQPSAPRFDRIKRDEVADLYRRIFRPENVWLAVGGPITPGSATDFWSSQNEDWKAGPVPRASLDQAPSPQVESVAGRESLIELRGKEIVGNDPSLPTQLLAVIGLGSGKGSAMFARLREAHGWSYRQESVLWPTLNGFVPRLIMASGDQTPAAELARAMKEDLLDAVDHWSEEDLARARGMAQGILTRGIGMSPLYFNPSWPVTDSIDDRTFMAGYWTMKTGSIWDPSRTLGQMALVSLSDLKDAARDILSNSIPQAIPARR